MKFGGVLALLALIERASAEQTYSNDDYYYGAGSVCLRFEVLCVNAEVQSSGKGSAKAMRKVKMGSAKAKSHGTMAKMGSMAKSGKGMHTLDLDDGCERVCVEFGVATVAPQDPTAAPLEDESMAGSQGSLAHSHGYPLAAGHGVAHVHGSSYLGTRGGAVGHSHDHFAGSFSSAAATNRIPVFGGSTLGVTGGLTPGAAPSNVFTTTGSSISGHTHRLGTHDHIISTTDTRTFETIIVDGQEYVLEPLNSASTTVSTIVLDGQEFLLEPLFPGSSSSRTIIVDGQEFLLEPLPPSSAAVNYDDYYLDDDFESSVTSGMGSSGSVLDAESAETDDVSAISGGKAKGSSTCGKGGKSGRVGKAGNGGKSGGVGKSRNVGKSGKVGIRGKSGRFGKSGRGNDGNNNAYDDSIYDDYTYDDYTYDDYTNDDGNLASPASGEVVESDDYYTDDSFCLQFATVCSRSISNGALRDTQCSRVCVEFVVQGQSPSTPSSGGAQSETVPSFHSHGSGLPSGSSGGQANPTTDGSVTSPGSSPSSGLAPFSTDSETIPSFHSHGSNVVLPHGLPVEGYGSQARSGSGSTSSHHSHSVHVSASTPGGANSSGQAGHSHVGSALGSVLSHHQQHYHDDSLAAKMGSMMSMKHKTFVSAKKKKGSKKREDDADAGKASKKSKTTKKGVVGKSMMSSKDSKSKDERKKAKKGDGVKKAKRSAFRNRGGVCSHYETVCSVTGSCVQICTEFDVVPGHSHSIPTHDHVAIDYGHGHEGTASEFFYHGHETNSGAHTSEGHGHWAVSGFDHEHFHGYLDGQEVAEGGGTNDGHVATSGFDHHHGFASGGGSGHGSGPTVGAFENQQHVSTYNRHDFFADHTRHHHHASTIAPTTPSPTEFVALTPVPTVFVAPTPTPTLPETTPPTARDLDFGGIDAPSPSPSAGKARSMGASSSSGGGACSHYEMICSGGKAKGKGGMSMSSMSSSSCQQTCVEYAPPNGSMGS